MESGQGIELPDDYYLSNFHALAGFVFTTYHDLLLASEREWYTSILRCDEAAQRLYVRLLTRKSSVFRLSRLRYPEIASLDSAAGQLAKENLATVEPPSSLQELMAAFTKPELLKLLNLNEHKSKSRLDLLDHIINCEEACLHQFRKVLQCADQWISIGGHAYWSIYNLCFFGNLYQDSSEFVLRDLGSVTYEPYLIAPDCRAFTSRAQLEAHLKYFECSTLLDMISRTSIEQHKEVLGELPLNIPGDSRLSRRLDRIRNKIARQLERLGDTNAALEIFVHSSHPPARERRVRILLSRGALDQAGSIIHDMTTNPWGEAELQVARRLHKKWSKLRGSGQKAGRRFRPETSVLTLSQSKPRVELDAQLFYAQLGACFYTENHLVNGVLGLFIWDIIFAPVEGAFHNPFQYAPSDFYDHEFCERRSALLKKRFTELDDSLRFSARVMDNFETRWGISNPMVRWSGISYDLLSLALQRIPAAHWRVMFDRILSDRRENMAGFPDLILFRDSDRCYELIEIKGPGDNLQPNQLRWMKYFSRHRIPCRVVNVRWAESTTTNGIT